MQWEDWHDWHMNLRLEQTSCYLQIAIELTAQPGLVNTASDGYTDRTLAQYNVMPTSSEPRESTPS